MSATAQKSNGHARAPRALAPAELKPAGGLMEALLAVQAAAPKLRRDATAQVNSPKGSYAYRYVTLGSLMQDVGPLLSEHGLVWLTLPTFAQDGSPALTYRLTHVASGEALEDTMALCCVRPDPQGQGSALTYARRYSLTAILNLVADEDDDGARASGATAYGVAPAQPVAQPTAAPAKASERPATVKQRNLIELRAREAELTEAELANVLKVAGGDQAILWKPGAAQRWIARAMDRLPARLVDAVLAGIAEKAGDQS
jgi:hypothetical protein